MPPNRYTAIADEILDAVMQELREGVKVQDILARYGVDLGKLKRCLDERFPGEYERLIQQRRAQAQRLRKKAIPLETIMTRMRKGESVDRLSDEYGVAFMRLKAELTEVYGAEYQALAAAHRRTGKGRRAKPLAWGGTGYRRGPEPINTQQSEGIGWKTGLRLP